MSTFAEKMVDFEIAVRLCLQNLQCFISRTDPLASAGRKRTSPCQDSLQAGCRPRTNVRPRRVHPQAFGPAFDHLTQPKILPHTREPQFQHSQEHREEDIQLQSDGVGIDHDHGWSASLHCPLLLPGRQERYFIIFTRARLEFEDIVG